MPKTKKVGLSDLAYYTGGTPPSLWMGLDVNSRRIQGPCGHHLILLSATLPLQYHLDLRPFLLAGFLPLGLPAYLLRLRSGPRVLRVL